jgi:hypothetical protein
MDKTITRFNSLKAMKADEYRLIVGGYAVSYHAQPRATKDLEILIGADASDQNSLRNEIPTVRPYGSRNAG